MIKKGALEAMNFRHTSPPAPEVGAAARQMTRKFSPMAENSPHLQVLIVDDEPLIRWSLAETLTDSGHTVIEAGDGEAAIHLLTTGGCPFDVVLLDYRLPDSNDLNLLATIRRMAPQSAVIMMTAFGTSDVAAGALQLGAYRIVSKPFEVHEIAELVVEAHAAVSR
jgi:DNA-binding NtrC family response regulator